MHFADASSSNQGSAGIPSKSGSGASKSSNKETNKTDAINTEAAQLFQLLDNVGSVFDITENKVNTILTKAQQSFVGRGRFCVCWRLWWKGNQGGCSSPWAEEQAECVFAFSYLLGSYIRRQLSPWVSPLQQCRQQDVAVTSAVDELLAVRSVILLAECGDFTLLVRKLENDLSKLQEDSRHQTRTQGSNHEPREPFFPSYNHLWSVVVSDILLECSPRNLRKWSNLTSIFFSNGLFSHQPVQVEMVFNHILF